MCTRREDKRRNHALFSVFQSDCLLLSTCLAAWHTLTGVCLVVCCLKCSSLLFFICCCALGSLSLSFFPFSLSLSSLVFSSLSFLLDVHVRPDADFSFLFLPSFLPSFLPTFPFPSFSFLPSFCNILTAICGLIVCVLLLSC